MSLNVYGKLTDEIEIKISKRLSRSGLLNPGMDWSESIQWFEFNGDSDKYRRALFIAARCCGMKPSIRFSWGWGHYGTYSKN
jgi:hypothetical protein